MFCKKYITLAAAHLAYPDLAVEKFSDTDPDQDAESIVQLTGRKIPLPLEMSPANAEQLANYNFCKKSLFSFSFRVPAADCYGSLVEAVTSWEAIRTDFITRFEELQPKFRNRLELEHCNRRDGKENRDFLRSIK